MSQEKQKCQYCGSDKDLFFGFVSLAIPDEKMEAKKQKYGIEWWKAMERTDLSEEEDKELDQLNFYDQLVNTIGRGVACEVCLQKEDDWYNKQDTISITSVDNLHLHKKEDGTNLSEELF